MLRSSSDLPQEAYIKQAYTKHSEMPTRLKVFLTLENCGFHEVHSRCMCRIGPYNADITALWNYKCSKKVT